MSGNQSFGINNVIEGASIACFAIGTDNKIIDSDSCYVEGKENIVGTSANDGRSNHCEGQSNIITSGENNHCEGVVNAISGDNNHAEGLQQTVANYQNHAEGAGHHVYGFQSHVEGYGNKTSENRAGQSLSGYRGVFLTEENKSFGTDNYNYSNQLAGGADAPNNNSIYPGEGIGVIDKIILNGRYPIGQHQSYLNTSDGLSYSIMLKGEAGLKQGTFVTFSSCKEKMLTKADCGDNIVGVITKTSGFIANAGQFAASERIEYDQYHNPVVFNNCVTSEKLESLTFKNCAPSEDNIKLLEKSKENPGILPCPEGKHLAFPAFQTIPKGDVTEEQRASPFVPYTQRDEYYQVALLGLVVVRVNSKGHISHMCDVKCGKAVDGDKYWVVKRIDKRHALILLK